LELGADKVRFAPVMLNALIAQVVAVHQPATDAKNLTLTFTPYDELPVVPGEENQLAQVITNLISNAINYTARGEIEVSTSANEREAVIEVHDTGLGIDSEDIPHLFERFYRGSRTRDIRGTGLGLAIVKEIVDLHDGRIEVESQIDVGTTFRVYLPLTARPISNGQPSRTT
jgi:signal transduction histidine kinase